MLCRVEWYVEQGITNWKGFGKNRPRYNRGIIPEFAGGNNENYEIPRRMPLSQPKLDMRTSLHRYRDTDVLFGTF